MPQVILIVHLAGGERGTAPVNVRKKPFHDRALLLDRFDAVEPEPDGGQADVHRALVDDLFHLEDLEPIPDFDGVEIADTQAAFTPCLDLPHVVLEPP